MIACASSPPSSIAFSGGADSAFLAWVAHDTLGPRSCPGRHRGVAVVAGRRARRLRAARPVMGTALARGRDRRDDERGLPSQRCRSVLPLQGRADGRGRAGRRTRRRDGAARCEPRRSRRPPAGPASGRTAWRALPARRHGLHQGRRARRVARSGPVRPGTSPRRRASRRACPTAPRSPSACSVRSSRPSEGCVRSDSPRCACATTTIWPASRCRSTTCLRWSITATRWWPSCAAAGYRYVTLDLEGLRSGNLNAALTPDEPGYRFRRYGNGICTRLRLEPVHASSATRVHVGKARCAAPSRSTMRPLLLQLVETRSGLIDVADHGHVVGHREQQRSR